MIVLGVHSRCSQGAISLQLPRIPWPRPLNANETPGNWLFPLLFLTGTPLRRCTWNPISVTSEKKIGYDRLGFLVFRNPSTAVLVRVPACAKVTGGSSTIVNSSAFRAKCCLATAASPLADTTPSGTIVKHTPPGLSNVRYLSRKRISDSTTFVRVSEVAKNGVLSPLVIRRSSTEKRAPKGGLVKIRSTRPSYSLIGDPSQMVLPKNTSSPWLSEKMKFIAARRTIRSTLS